MIAFTFHFPNDPTGADKSLRIGIIAESQEEAWQKIAQKLNFSVDHLREYSPTIQMTELRSGEIIVSRPGTLAGTDDMWPYIVQEGIRDITSVLSERVGSAQDRRFQVELERLGIDRLVIIVFSIAFLGALVGHLTCLLPFPKRKQWQCS
jgi:hypothetical protein